MDVEYHKQGPSQSVAGYSLQDMSVPFILFLWRGPEMVRVLETWTQLQLSGFGEQVSGIMACLEGHMEMFHESR